MTSLDRQPSPPIYVAEDPKPSVLSRALKQAVDKNGDPIHKYQARAHFVLQESRVGRDLILEIQKRLQKEGGTQTNDQGNVLCYKTTAGFWVPELRKESRKKGTPLDTDAILKRISAMLLSGANTAHVRLDDASSKGWQALVALLESAGYSVTALTAELPYGAYIGKGLSETGELQGEHLKGIRPTALLVRKSVAVVHGARPQAQSNKPGLNWIPSLGMAFAVFKDREWSQTQVLPSGKVALNLMDNTAIQYAQSGFEGLIAELDEDGNICLLNADENEDRLQETAKALGMPPLPEGQMIQSMIAVLEQNRPYFKNPGDRLYIRPYMFGTKGGAGASAAKEYLFGVEVIPFANYYTPGGAGAVMEVRLDVQRPPTGGIKTAANYAPNFAAKAATKNRLIAGDEAKPTEGQTHYSDLLACDTDGNIEEVSAAAFFAVRRDQNSNLYLHTPPTQEDRDGEGGAETGQRILPSITRRMIILFAQAMGMTVNRSPLHSSALANPEGQDTVLGAFCAGTAAGITPIRRLDVKTSAEDTDPSICEFNDAQANQLTETLQNFLNLARGGKLENLRAALLATPNGSEMSTQINELINHLEGKLIRIPKRV